MSMFGFLKRKKRCRPVYRLPEDLRVYAVGDIHGRVDLLRPLHEAMARDAEDAGCKMENRVVYLGDYLDRGPYVRETLEELQNGPPDGFHAEYLKGNHEELFLDFLRDPSFLSFWLEIGGSSTLMSYQLQPPAPGFPEKRAAAVRDELLAAMPPHHLAFLENLKPYILIGDVAFVHAGIRPGIPLARQSGEDLYWMRAGGPDAPGDCGVRVIHGHTISEDIVETPFRVGVDTGAYATGRLGCAVLEGETVRRLTV